LRGPAKAYVQNASPRVFDVGYEVRAGASMYVAPLNADAIAAIAKVAGSLRVTVYPPLDVYSGSKRVRKTGK
jgi:hypothetical protein